MNERERDVEKKKNQNYNLFQKRTIFSLFFNLWKKKKADK